MSRELEVKTLQQGVGNQPALEGHQAWLYRGRRGAPARLAADRAHPGPPRCREAVEPDEQRAVRQRAGRADGQPGHAAGQGRPEGDRYLSGWQVAGDANSNGEMYPDQSLYSVDSVPKVVKRINNTFQRADQSSGRKARTTSISSPRSWRMRKPAWRRAERVRADEGDDRSGRLGRALRRPAGGCQEVRPHGGQGAGADA